MLNTSPPTATPAPLFLWATLVYFLWEFPWCISVSPLITPLFLKLPSSTPVWLPSFIDIPFPLASIPVTVLTLAAIWSFSISLFSFKRLAKSPSNFFFSSFKANISEVSGISFTLFLSKISSIFASLLFISFFIWFWSPFANNLFFNSVLYSSKNFIFSSSVALPSSFSSSAFLFLASATTFSLYPLHIKSFCSFISSLIYFLKMLSLFILSCSLNCELLGLFANISFSLSPTNFWYFAILFSNSLAFSFSYFFISATAALSSSTSSSGNENPEILFVKGTWKILSFNSLSFIALLSFPP